MLILCNAVLAVGERVIYTTERTDKYTISVSAFLREESVDNHLEITSYSISHGNKTVRIFYRETAHPERNKIDISLRGIPNPNEQHPVRIILYNVQQENAIPFNDIERIESERYIRHLHDAGFIEGYADGTFRPSNTISRAEFATMLVRVLGYEMVEEGDTQFEDIKNHWARREMMTAVNHGIMQGYDNVTIAPEDRITIGQVAIMLDRAYRINTHGQGGVYVKLPVRDHYAKASVKNMLDARILKTEDSTYNNFDIDRPATRAECAMMISRAMVY